MIENSNVIKIKMTIVVTSLLLWRVVSYLMYKTIKSCTTSLLLRHVVSYQMYKTMKRAHARLNVFTRIFPTNTYVQVSQQTRNILHKIHQNLT